MSTTDIIQLITALVAVAALFLSLWNIHITKKNIKTQDEQWAFNQVPVFKIIKVQPFDAAKNILIIENHNDVFYQIKSVHFNDNKIKASSQKHGKVETSITKNGVLEKKEYEGFQVALDALTKEKVRGHVTLRGVDRIGNEFSCKSENIVFRNGTIDNIYDLTKTYFIKE